MSARASQSLVGGETLADRVAGARALAFDVGLVVTGAVVIGLTALVSVRLPDNPVPVTGQTLGVLAVAAALGGGRGIAATSLYVAIGVLGIPAFAEGRGGVGVIATIIEGRLVLGATGGYLAGFLLAAVVVGRLAERGWDRRLPWAIAAMGIGNIAIYALGLPWLAAATGYSPAEVLAKGLLPFLAGDLLKLALAGALLPAVWWLVGRTR